jgi:hypothetical protein
MAKGIVAISVSDGPDLAIFGFLPQHLRRLLAALAGATLRAGWRVGYGGDLRRDGFTRSLLADMAAAYARGGIERGLEAPVVHFFALSSWREMPPEAILNHLLDKELKPGDAPIAPVAETRFFLPPGGPAPFIAVVVQDGNLRDPETGAAIEKGRLLDDLARAAEARVEPGAALTTMRQAMAVSCPLRIQFSGRVADYAGERPGIIEEAVEQIRGGGIVMPLGAFGGAARDVAIVLRLLEASRTTYPRYGENYDRTLGALEGLGEAHWRKAEAVWGDLAAAASLSAPHRVVFHLRSVLEKLGG